MSTYRKTHPIEARRYERVRKRALTELANQFPGSYRKIFDRIMREEKDQDGRNRRQ